MKRISKIRNMRLIMHGFPLHGIKLVIPTPPFSTKVNSEDGVWVMVNDKPMYIDKYAFEIVEEKLEPKPSKFGYQGVDGSEDEPGWTIEGGEEAYEKALSEYDKLK